VLELYVTREPMTLVETVSILQEAGYPVYTYGGVMVRVVGLHGKSFYLGDRRSFLRFLCYEWQNGMEHEAEDRLEHVVGESLGRDVNAIAAVLDMTADPDAVEELLGVTKFRRKQKR
jgi:hypothetical protein